MGIEYHKFMNIAIELAKKGEGWVNPNPLVGAVIVKNGAVIGEGFHQLYGGLHAERNALKNCTVSPEGATMFVTLEPCCHYGKTPPCTEAIIESKIAKVVIAALDPNPLVAGKGVEQLKNAGIEVVVGVLGEQAQQMNRAFIKYITTSIPWVVMKWAMSLDGKIATRTGSSKWVTGAEARTFTHKLRAKYVAIMVGVGTAGIDNPMLNCRTDGEVRQPIRVVVDSGARLSLESNIVKTASQYRTILAHTCKADSEVLNKLCVNGVEPLLCSSDRGRVDISDLLLKLGALKIDSILLEGGGELNEAFVKASLVDELYAFIAPKIVGGRAAKTPVEGEGVEFMSEAVTLKDIVIEPIGKDILINGLIDK